MGGSRRTACLAGLFIGYVQRIGGEPEFAPCDIANQGERVNTFYVVEIAPDNEQGLLKPGIPGDAVFGEEKAPSCLTLGDLLATAVADGAGQAPVAYDAAR